jgi:hypothetical protein
MRHLLIAALMLLPAQAAQLRITVYDQAHLPKQVSQFVFDQLRQVFHQAGIEIEVVAGDATAAEASLITVPATPRRGSEQETACRARRDIALEIVGNTQTFRKDSILGVAVPLAREGLNARVFDEHVRDLAVRQSRDYATLLAHAMAHEIGHVLLRSSAHIRSGLMSAVWTDAEFKWMARSMMFFTGDQSKAMRASLSGIGCPAASAEMVHQENVGTPPVAGGNQNSGAIR